jgi:hypothetical protein
MSPRRLGPHLQPFFDIQPINQFVVHLPAFSFQEDMKTLIAIADPRGRQVAKSYAEFGPIILSALVTLRGTRLIKYTTSTSLADLVGHLQIFHKHPSTIGP